MRNEIHRLVELGRLPSEEDADVESSASMRWSTVELHVQSPMKGRLHFSNYLAKMDASESPHH